MLQKYFSTVTVVAFLGILIFLSPSNASFASPLPIKQITGICYTTYQRPETYLTAASDQKLLHIAATNAGWVNLRVSWSQAGYTSTDIEPNFATPSDDAVLHVIRFCHQHHLKVLLSLMVDFAEDNAGGAWHWWGQIAPVATFKANGASAPLSDRSLSGAEGKNSFSRLGKYSLICLLSFVFRDNSLARPKAHGAEPANKPRISP